MVLNAVLIANRAGALLASRFFDGSSNAVRLDWQQTVFTNLAASWPQLRDSTHLASLKYVPSWCWCVRAKGKLGRVSDLRCGGGRGAESAR